MSEQYLIAHDLGTSGVKAALTDITGRVHRRFGKSLPGLLQPGRWRRAGPRGVVGGYRQDHARDDGKSRHPAHPGGGHEHGRPDGGHRTGG